MAQPLSPDVSRPLALLCVTVLLAACGNSSEPNENAAGRPSEEQVSATAPTPPAEAAPPPSGPAPSQPASTDGLPLRPGVYVVAGSSCASPANAAFRVFDGRGISGSATRACRLTVRSSNGDAYRVDQSCEDTYSGQRSTASQTIRIPDVQSFTLAEQGEAAMNFRLCAAGEAPDHLQDMVSAG